MPKLLTLDSLQTVTMSQKQNWVRPLASGLMAERSLLFKPKDGSSGTVVIGGPMNAL